MEDESLELPTHKPQFESSMIADGEDKMDTSGGLHGSQDDQMRMEIEVHDTSEVKGRTLNIVVSNPMASISGDISCSFVTVDLDAYGSLTEESVECEGDEEVSTSLRPIMRKRCLTRFGQAVKNLCLDLKLFFW